MSYNNVEGQLGGRMYEDDNTTQESVSGRGRDRRQSRRSDRKERRQPSQGHGDLPPWSIGYGFEFANAKGLWNGTGIIMYLPFTRTSIATTVTTNFSIEPTRDLAICGVKISCEPLDAAATEMRDLVESDVALLGVTEFKVGSDSLFGGTGEIPATMFINGEPDEFVARGYLTRSGRSTILSIKNNHTAALVVQVACYCELVEKIED